jgi:Putative Actinobacterial Holin-X, holin superfamily III
MIPTDEKLRVASADAEELATSDSPIGELVGRLSDDTVRLVRDEIRLARAEMTQKAKAAGIGGGLFAGAGICGLYGIGVLIAAAVVGLSLVVALWVATLIVAVALFTVAGFAALMGKRELGRAGPPLPIEAVQSTRQDVDELKRGLRQ